MANNQFPQRHLGIDLLRIVAMFSICFGHLLCQGGVLDLFPNNSWARLYLSFFSCLLDVPCCLNCFALLSGYLAMRHFKSNLIKTEHLIRFEFQALFFTIGIASLFYLFHVQISKEQWLQTFFPVLTIHYWYLSAYMPILLLSPFIISGVQITSKTTLRSILWLLFFFICVLSQVPLFTQYSNWLAGNFSVHWLLFCFVLGCFVSKYGFGSLLPKTVLRFLPKQAYIGIIIFLLCCAVNWSLEYAFPFWGQKWLAINIPSIWRLGSYKSPINVLAAMSLLFTFLQKKNISCCHSCILSVIKWASAGSFGVYLFHCNNLILVNVLNNTHHLVKQFHYLLLPIALLLLTLAYYLAGATIDTLRRYVYTHLASRLFSSAKLT